MPLSTNQSMPSLRDITGRFTMLKGFWALALLFVLAITPIAGNAAHGDVYNIFFTEDMISYDSREGYDIVRLAGGEFITQEGHPMLPTYMVAISIPYDSRVESFEIVPIQVERISGDFWILPGRLPSRMSSVDSQGPLEPNEAIYSASEPYPSLIGEFAGEGSMAGHRIASFLLHPVRFTPADRMLELVRHVRIEVSLEPRQSPLEIPAENALRERLFTQRVKQLVINPEAVEQHATVRGGIPLQGETVDYLVIADSALAGHFQPLVDWKTKKGLKCESISTASIYATYSGADNKEKIRNCIKDYYINHGTVYVLLGGDTGDIPARETYCNIASQNLTEEEKHLPCDLYYSDLDGDWNAGGDPAEWGEHPADSVDMYADVYVGRVPAADTSDVSNFVDKILIYEGSSSGSDTLPTDYILDMLFMAEYLDGSTNGGVAKNIIDDDYVPSRYDPITKLYESRGNLDEATAIDSLNAGQSIVNHVGHAYYNNLSIGDDYLLRSDFDYLTNAPKFGVFYSTGCYASAIDYNTISEHWINSTGGGGVGFVGNSRLGWYTPGEPDVGHSNLYDRRFFWALFSMGYCNQGVTHAEAKDIYVGASKSGVYFRYCLYGLNLLGDPEMPIWTDTPENLNVAHNSLVPIGTSLFEVSVSSEESPVEGAVVCLWKGDEVYLVDETNASGVASFNPDPSTTGAMLITVTKHNYLPHEGSATVVEPYEIVLYSDFLGPGFPSGYADSLWRDRAKVIIGDSVYTTPVDTTLTLCQDTVIVYAPSFSSCSRDDVGLIGHGAYDHWSCAGDTILLTGGGVDTLTVYYDITSAYVGGSPPHVTNSLETMMDDWVGEGDTLLVQAGTYECSDLEIDRSMTMISASGRQYTTLYCDGCDAMVKCDSVSGATIGSSYHGFTFETRDELSYYVYLKDSDNISVASNEFEEDGVSNFRYIDGGVCVDRCRDVDISSNKFPYGWLHAVEAQTDTNLTIYGNDFYYYSATQRIGNPRLYLQSCKDVGIYCNALWRPDQVAFPVIKLDACSGDIVIGGDLAHGNELRYAYVEVVTAGPPRIDGECNYWGWMNYSDLYDELDEESGGRLDFVPWANGVLGLKYVPFDGEETYVYVPEDSVALCPAGDFDPLVMTLRVRNSLGNPVEGMWCDDVEALWIEADPETLFPCGEWTLFDGLKTNSSGNATDTASTMGGCGLIEIVGLEGIALSDTAIIEVHSPDCQGDGVVDLVDFGHFASRYLTTDTCCDYDFSGLVDMVDYGEFASHFTHSCPIGTQGNHIDLVGEDGSSWEAARLLAADGRDHVVAGAGLVRFGVYVPAGQRKGLRVVELAVHCDGSVACPVHWDSEGLHMLRIGAEGQTFIATEVREARRGGERELIGILGFETLGTVVDFVPRLDFMRGATASGDLIDLVGEILPLIPGADVTAEYALKPLLKLGNNPAAGSVVVRFGAGVEDGRRLRLDVYDVRGRLVSRPFEGLNDGVIHTVEIGLSGPDLKLDSPGVYFVQLSADGRRVCREKVVLLQ